KLAVLDMYLHIFPPGRVRVAIYTAMGLNAAYAVVFLPLFLTICIPTSAFWSLDPVVHRNKCRSKHSQEYRLLPLLAANMVLDLAVVLIPLPSIWQLQLPPQKKLFVTLMFSIGLVVVGVMAWRVHTTLLYIRTLDWSYVLGTLALQTHLELWLGILAANLPLMGPLFTK
ncbi:hypothetical protein BCR34DRAFT_470403, partial [Clohesyomyces aquaticus]